jgi:hypothetical protein
MSQQSGTTVALEQPSADVRRFLGGDLTLAVSHGPTAVFRVLRGEYELRAEHLPNPGGDEYLQGFLAALGLCLDRDGDNSLTDLASVIAEPLPADNAAKFDLIGTAVVGWMKSEQRDMGAAQSVLGLLSDLATLVELDESSDQAAWYFAKGWTDAMSAVIRLLIGPRSSRSLRNRPADWRPAPALALGHAQPRPRRTN